MRKLLTAFILFFSLLSVTLHAQQIKGRVIDKTTSEPLPFANIVVLDNNTAATGTVTDADGNFALASEAETKNIKISYLGYITKDTIASRSTFNTIMLAQDANLLDEVVIKATRKIFKMENGGISTDVANSPLSSLGTANDVLEKLPFVVKDGDALSVLGKGTPLIYINNRLVRNANELERLSSTNIKKVTVITNPGPEYDATVSAVIRIEATRPPGEGLGGEVFGKLDFRNKLSSTTSVDLNYRINNLDIFGYYWYNDNRRKVENYLERLLETDQQATNVIGDGVEMHHYENHYAEGGLNYMFNENHSIGGKYIYETSPKTNINLDLPTRVYINNTLADELCSTSLFEMDSRSHLLNAYYTGSLATWLKVQLDFDYASGDSKNRQTSLTTRTDEETVATRSLQDYDLYAAKLTLTTPVWGSELKYGIEYSRTTNEQNYIVDDNEGAEDLESNTNLSKQKLFAAFANYSRSINKWAFSLGARFENVNFDYFENANRVDEQSRTYNDFFPTASISYQGEKIQMMLGYRATISRPSYYQLRNGIQFDDPYTYETGNPYLKPTKVSDISYSLLWRDVKFMASYKIYSNRTLFVPQQYKDMNIVLYRPENLKNSQNLSVSAYYSPRFGIWKPTVGMGVSKDFLAYTAVRKEKFDDPYLFYSFQNTFELPAGFVLMADIQGRTKGHSALMYMYDNFSLNMRLTKKFFNDKLILNLQGQDVLGTSKSKYGMNVYPVTSLADKKNDTQAVILSVRYKFNATRSKYKGESASEAERGRL
ncbi:TonB-dependent receptor domain-containing protein [Bacteroides sp. 214]|uniref:TonB-dependent receptor domain-containing protein n=1 Tax=Bacteroides sp. 214 TaxID=2302935 RepID=UPI001EF2DFB5|nr:TonB-dependent receptor [Bacteroides sp. 214]